MVDRVQTSPCFAEPLREKEREEQSCSFDDSDLVLRSLIGEAHSDHCALDAASTQDGSGTMAAGEHPRALPRREGGALASPPPSEARLRRARVRKRKLGRALAP